MTLIPEKAQEPDLAYRHVLRVLAAIEPRATEADVLEAACYVKSGEDGRLAESYWSGRGLKSRLKVYLVDQLPRTANFEWEIVIKMPSCDE